MTNILDTITNFIGDIADDIKYDVLKLPYPQFSEIAIPNKLDLTLHFEKDGAWVESPDLPDFYAVANDLNQLPLAIHQAILLYCGVPRYFARRQPTTGIITLPDGSSISLVDSIEKKLKYA